MKLTWFGGRALRVYAGGQILVIDPDGAPQRVDWGELLAGADRVVAADEPLRTLDLAGWRAPVVPRLAEDVPPAEIGRIGADTLLVAVPGDAPLVVIGTGGLPEFGRWADGAVVVVLARRTGLVNEMRALLANARVRLIALALDEAALDEAIAGLAPYLDGTGLVSLEAGLALEV